MKVNIEFELDDNIWGEYKDSIEPELFIEDLFSNWHGKDGVEKVTLKSINGTEEVNVNRTIKVTLTEAGAKVMNNYINDELQYLSKDQINTIFGRDSFKAGDEYESMLWEIMNIFGKSMFMGCDVPFVKNKFVLV